MSKKPRYITKLDKIPELSAEDRDDLAPVVDKYVFRTNEYYQSLIDWSDPADPIRRIVMPQVHELKAGGALDASDESRYTKAPGLEHKYRDTALLLVNNVCGAYCRFCFRKRLFMADNDEVQKDVSPGLAYIEQHPEINNVLLTGGDPLLLSNARLEAIFQRLRSIPHVRIIRIGSKLPAFNPFRIADDEEFLAMLAKYSQPDRRIYLMAHFNHPRELTSIARKALDKVIRAGVVVVNQSPILRGVNDSVETLTALFNELSFIGVPPYYVFLNRPVVGNREFNVPVETALAIFEKARHNGSGLAKRARLSMSDVSGKIEVAGQADGRTFFRYHRAANPADKGRFFSLRSNPKAYWIDEYDDYSPEPYYPDDAEDESAREMRDSVLLEELED